MKKLKSKHDRLSELPDSLILEILSLLEMRDVVKTTLLSKRWKNFWITIPCLKFSEMGHWVQISKFISRALALWRGTYLRKFKIFFFCDSHPSLSSDIDSWVLFAKERNVEELCIKFNKGNKRYCPPQCLYECSSIRKLSLRGCNLQIRGNVLWDRLNSLKLSICLFSDDVLNEVLSSSPQLEIFKLYWLEESQNLSIRSSSLKKLLICCYKSSAVTTIWAPNLEALTFEEGPCSKYLLTDVSSLSDVCLDFQGDKSAEVGEALCQILPAIQHVATVELSASCFQMLGVIKGNYSFSPLLNVKLLTIGSWLIELSDIVGLFESFPKLKKLIIYWNSNKQFKFDAENYIESEANILKSNLLQLRTVVITWHVYKASFFEFIGFLLKHATMIEKMIIRKNRHHVVRSKDMFLAAQKVMLRVIKGNYSFSPLLNVKLLTIDSWLIELSDIVGLLESFPKLKMLIIHWKSVGEQFQFDAENYIESEANILKSNWLQLRTVVITWYAYKASFFEFIGFLLKHATMIEKMVIRKKG